MDIGDPLCNGFSCGDEEEPNAYVLQIYLHFIYEWEYHWGFLLEP